MFHKPKLSKSCYELPKPPEIDYGEVEIGIFVFLALGYEIRCLASIDNGIEHVSVTINRDREPGWKTMCFVKDQFWDDEDLVVQFHPPKSNYVNIHDCCLHMWSSPEIRGIMGSVIEKVQTS